MQERVGSPDRNRLSVLVAVLLLGCVLYRFAGVAGDRLGAAVDAGRDIDADGHPDLIVGAPGDDAAGIDFGAALAYSGGDGSLLYRLSGRGSGQDFGAAVAGIGDWDGDGHDDLLVGAPRNDDQGLHAGLGNDVSFEGWLGCRA